MKEIHRSKRTRLSHRRYHHHQQFPKPNTNDNDNDDDDDDESDFEDQLIHEKSVIQTNKNANQMPLILFDTISTLPIENKLQETIISSKSDQSSLFLYSINSIPKPIAISDDLTLLTKTTTNTTALTVLTCSNTKQIETLKIDLTELTSTDTLDTSDPDQSLSSININKKRQTYDTDTSMKSVVFSKINSLEDQLSYQKHTSCFTIPGIEIQDPMIIETSAINTNVNTCQHPPVRWNPSRWSLQNMTSKLKIFIGCLSLGLIAGIVILIIIL
ncbi:hypothetical protein I4U23_028518 [Adineta vaga]|nr:hypothetical protein I4U23_028518 [Adineta vaga]